MKSLRRRTAAIALWLGVFLPVVWSVAVSYAELHSQLSTALSQSLTRQLWLLRSSGGEVASLTRQAEFLDALSSLPAAARVVLVVRDQHEHTLAAIDTGTGTLQASGTHFEFPWEVIARKAFLELNGSRLSMSLRLESPSALQNWIMQALVSLLLASGAASVLSWLLLRAGARGLSLESELKRAINRDELAIRYQPIVELHSGRCIGVEALARWQHPELGDVPVSVFIEAAERSALIFPLTRWLLRHIAQDLGELYRAYPHLHVGINLPIELFAQDWLLNEAREAFESQLSFHQLMFEISGQLQPDAVSTQRVMQALRAMGCRIAIDDYGVRHAAPLALQRFGIDLLKIDRRFVEGIESRDRTNGFVDLVLKAARSLEIPTIAVGIERNDQLEYLRNSEVYAGQGFLFAEPMGAGPLMDYLQDNLQRH